jgi:hypothetical protein
MAGLIPLAPWYVNGLLSLVCLLILPGLVLVQFFKIGDFPLRWLVVVLSSLTANHAFVTMVATFGGQPLNAYRFAVVVLAMLTIILLRFRGEFRSSAVQSSDIRWMVIGAVALGFAYFNLWKAGVPRVFGAGDVSSSWNAWTLVWANGTFPSSSYGYPQFVPTIWALPYIFTGSSEHYFAFYIYVFLITVPLLLNSAILGRGGWQYPVAQGMVFVWFVAEIQEGWLRATLQNAFPDWIAAIFIFCGCVLFLTRDRAADEETDWREICSLGFVTIAAATKPIAGLVAAFMFLEICREALLARRGNYSTRIAACAVVLAIFALSYWLNYIHLSVRSLPNYPVADLSERLSRALHLFNSNFSIVFRLLVAAGLGLSLWRARWLIVPLFVGLWLWADTASYDLRNALGLLLIAAFIPVYVLIEWWRSRAVRKPDLPSQRPVSDPAAASIATVLLMIATLPIAHPHATIAVRYGEDQMREGAGEKINGRLLALMRQHCTVFSGDAYPFHISALKPYLSQLVYFPFSTPMKDDIKSAMLARTGCFAVLFPPAQTHLSNREFFAGLTDREMGRTSVTDGEDLIEYGAP